MEKRDQSYTNKCQDNIPCSYGYKLRYVDDRFSKYSKFFLDEDAV